MAYPEPRFITENHVENHVILLKTGLVQVTFSPEQPSGPVAGSENRTSVLSTILAQIGVLFCLRWFRIVWALTPSSRAVAVAGKNWLAKCVSII